jgi:hypothetical protein
VPGTVLLHTARTWLARRPGNDRVALASYPRSGNTWLRFLVEEATGEESGSISDDRVLRRGREGILVKTHALDAYEYGAAVHVVRHPLDAIRSWYRWKLDVAGDEVVDWDEHVAEGIRHWRGHTWHWSHVPYRRLVVRYEDLGSDTAGELERVLRWLGRQVDDSAVERAAGRTLEDMRELSPELGEAFFRSGRADASPADFSADQLAELERKLGRHLDSFGYDRTSLRVT